MKTIKHLVRPTLLLLSTSLAFSALATKQTEQSNSLNIETVDIEANSTSSTANHTPLADGIYSPEHGIICDQKAGFCVDGFGISMAFTQTFLGEDAQNKMLKMIEEVGGSDNFDSSRFSFSNKVYCDSTERRCFDDRYSDTQQTQFTDVLFAEEE
ncbi:YcgJ family protein [Photobacterium swingsii]|uniref:YcgJ family protein n=1 Tax=Photobacterium swingsii TaxID=680026 RepID=UPI003552020F